LFDATEIDEILKLRILTLTDEEKEEIRRADGRERRLLERAESLTPEELLKLHGTMRNVRSGLKPGDRVRIRPRPGGDILDVILKGHVAVVESIEQDFENRTHIAVTVEGDPGKDLGLMHQPGHRFFFSEDELELIA
jgi:hydrogenase maturation protease